MQGNYPAALTAWTEARETFTQLNEPASVAVAWHQIGWVHQEAGQYEAAEHAYQASLRIAVQMGNSAGQASTLTHLGSLYSAIGRREDAVRFALQAAEHYVTLHDLAGEGRARNNAANDLIALRRYDKARRELQRASLATNPSGTPLNRGRPLTTSATWKAPWAMPRQRLRRASRPWTLTWPTGALAA